MTYNLGIKVSNGLSYAMVVSDSRATFDDRFGAGIAGENWAKTFLIPKKPGKSGTQDFILAGSGNFGLLYGARQAVIDKGPFYDISKVNDILLSYIKEARKNYSDGQVPSFIVAGPNRERKLSMVHIDDVIHQPEGYKECMGWAQGGSGFEYVQAKAEKNLANKGKFEFDIDNIDSAVSLGVRLLRQIARHDPGVNEKPQLLVMRYDGKTTRVGMIYPPEVRLNTGQQNDQENFTKQYARVMSGLNDLLDLTDKKRAHKFLETRKIVPYGSEKMQLTKDHFDDLFMKTSQDLSEFYDRFMFLIKFIHDEKNQAYQHDAQNSLTLALNAIVDHNLEPFLAANRNLRVFSERQKA